MRGCFAYALGDWLFCVSTSKQLDVLHTSPHYIRRIYSVEWVGFTAPIFYKLLIYIVINVDYVI